MQRSAFVWKTALAVVAFAAVSWLAPAASAQSTLEKAKKAGTIKVGYAGEVPWAYLGPDGKLTGSDPEIAKVIFKKLGVNNVDAVLVEWSGLIPGLKAGRFDVIAAGMYIKPERCKEVLFADPHAKVGWGLLVKKGNPKKLHSYADIAKDKTAKVSTMSGSSDLPIMRREGIPEDRILGVPDVAGQIAAVKTGRVDAASHNPLTVMEMVKMAGAEFERAAPFKLADKDMGYPAFVFRKDDKAFRDEFNKHLKDMITKKEILKVGQPFGFTEAELTTNEAAEKLCAG